MDTSSLSATLNRQIHSRRRRGKLDRQRRRPQRTGHLRSQHHLAGSDPGDADDALQQPHPDLHGDGERRHRSGRPHLRRHESRRHAGGRGDRRGHRRRLELGSGQPGSADRQTHIRRDRDPGEPARQPRRQIQRGHVRRQHEPADGDPESDHDAVERHHPRSKAPPPAPGTCGQDLQRQHRLRLSCGHRRSWRHVGQMGPGELHDAPRKRHLHRASPKRKARSETGPGKAKRRPSSSTRAAGSRP